MVSKSVLAGTLVCALLGQPGLGQPAQEQAQQSAAPQQQIPDGPKPQILPPGPVTRVWTGPKDGAVKVAKMAGWVATSAGMPLPPSSPALTIW